MKNKLYSKENWFWWKTIRLLPPLGVTHYPALSESHLKIINVNHPLFANHHNIILIMFFLRVQTFPASNASIPYIKTFGRRNLNMGDISDGESDLVKRIRIISILIKLMLISTSPWSLMEVIAIIEDVRFSNIHMQR